MSGREQIKIDLYTAIAQWLWGVHLSEMAYGPPNRGLRDRFASYIYHKGIAIERKTCPTCGRPADTSGE